MRWLLPIVLVACVEHEPADPQVTAGVTIKDIPISVNRRADVLFVIDDAPAMAPYATNVRANLDRFISILRASPYGFPNLRLAVIAGDGEGLRTTTGMLGPFAVDFVGSDANRVRNYDGDITDVFARLSDVGTDAASSQPFTTARTAIEHPSFLRRDEAATIVYLISATDAAPIEGAKLAVILRATHRDPSQVIVAGIAPDGAQAMSALLERFPNRSFRAAIDDPDWASKMFSIIADGYRTSLGSPCIEGPLVDLEVLKPGLQPACSVEYLFPIGGRIVPPCVGDLVGTQCFRIVENNVQCPSSATFGESRLFKIDQPSVEIPEGTHMWIECLSRYDE